MSVDVQRFATDTAVRTYTSAEIDALIVALGSTYLKLDCSNDPLTGDLDLDTHNLTTTGTGTFSRAVLQGALSGLRIFDRGLGGGSYELYGNTNYLRLFLYGTGDILTINGTGADFTSLRITTTGEVNVFNNIEILGNYYLRFRDLGDTTTYLYMMATSAMGGGGYISAVNIPFELRYGALGSVTQLSMDTNGNIVWNYGAGNCDFTINKNALGQAYVYDAGLDTHTFSGYATFEDGWRAEAHSEMVAGQRLYFDGA